MRMSRSGRSAADVIAHASVEELSRILANTGRNGWRSKSRGNPGGASRGPITTTRQLSRIVARVKGDTGKDRPGDTRLPGAAHRGQRGAAVALPFPRGRGREAERGRRLAVDLVSLSRGPDGQGDVPARVGRLPLPAEASGLRLRRAPRLRGPDAPPDPSVRMAPRSAANAAVSERGVCGLPCGDADPAASRRESEERAREHRRLRPVEARREPAPDARAGPPARPRARDVPLARASDRVRTLAPGWPSTSRRCGWVTPAAP